MTPTTKTVEIICNDAPEDIKNHLKCAIMGLDEKDRAELLRPYIKKYYEDN